MPNVQIAEYLGITYSAVRRHYDNMMMRNCCKTMHNLITKYYRNSIRIFYINTLIDVLKRRHHLLGKKHIRKYDASHVLQSERILLTQSLINAKLKEIFMNIEGRTIIISSPKELISIVVEAIRIAGLQAYPERENYDPPNKRLLSSKDVEREYGIRRRMLHIWRIDGVGPEYITLGRKILYERQVIEEFIAAGRIETDSHII